ncbi:MAG: ABC transporter permease, partial [Cyanobacteria bacterium]|nr:ABC transporter permease [Cyanobacteriota bacterium]
TATQTAGGSLTANTGLITKVYFPRLVIPISHLLPAMLDLSVSLVVFFLLMLYFGVQPTWRLLFLPVFVLLAFLTALGASLWISALSVQYRDVRHVIPFLMQLWMFASPVAYSSGLISSEWRALYSFNPVVAIIDGFRWSTLGIAGYPLGTEIAGALCTVILLLATGVLYFRRMERTFADVI